MGRPRKGWYLRKPRPPVQPNYAVRFTNKAGEGIELTTGTADPHEAARIGAELYARDQVGAGVAVTRVSPLLALDELLATWLADVESTLDPETVTTYTAYAKRFALHFGTLGGITRPAMAAYQRGRLAHVLVTTVRKERSALNSFLKWCIDEEVLREEDVPAWPRISSKATGKRSGPQRAKPVDVTAAEVDRFLRALPLWSRPRKGSRHAVRAFFVAMYETSLRPATLAALRLGVHWKRGSRDLDIPAEDDKARFGRRVPISDLALAALESVAFGLALVDGDLIFGDHDRRASVAHAKTAASLPKDFAPYDLRHGRIGHLIDRPDAEPRAVMYLAGHTLMTTTNKYVRGQEEGARRMLGPGLREEDGRRSAEMLSAKEGNRTLTGVTPLEPESSAKVPDSCSSAHVDGLSTPKSDSVDLSLRETPGNEIPKSVGDAARFLAVLRTSDEALEAALRDELFGGGS